jgi:hypothetical protein
MSPRLARAWTALLLPPAVWYLQEQGLAGPLRINCHVADGLPALAWGAASLLLCLGAAWLARPLAHAPAEGESPTAPWIARLAMLGAGVFALAIAFGSLAAALVPACAR